MAKRQRVIHPENRSPTKSSKGFIMKGFRHFSCKHVKLVASKYPFLKAVQIRSRVKKLWNRLPTEKKEEYGHSPEKIQSPSPTKFIFKCRLSPDLYALSPSKAVNNNRYDTNPTAHQRTLKTSWQSYLNTSHKDPEEPTSKDSDLLNSQHTGILVSHNEDKPKSKNKKQVTFQLFPKKNLFQTTGAPSEISQGLNPKESDSSKDHQETLLLLLQSTGNKMPEVSVNPKESDSSKDPHEAMLQSKGTSKVSLSPNETDSSNDLPDDLQKDPVQFEGSETPEMTVIAAEISTESSVQVETIQIVNGVMEEKETDKDVICKETGELEVIKEAGNGTNTKDGDNLHDLLPLGIERDLGITGQSKEARETDKEKERETMTQVVTRSKSSSKKGDGENQDAKQLVDEKDDSGSNSTEDHEGINNKINSRNGVATTLPIHQNQVNPLYMGSESVQPSVAGQVAGSSSEVTPKGMLPSPDVDHESHIVAQILAELGIIIAQDISPRSKSKVITQSSPNELEPSSEVLSAFSHKPNQVSEPTSEVLSDVSHEPNQVSDSENRPREEDIESEISARSVKQPVIIKDHQDQGTAKDQELKSNSITTEDKLQDRTPASIEQTNIGSVPTDNSASENQELPVVANDSPNPTSLKDKDQTSRKVPSPENLISTASVVSDDQPHEKTVTVSKSQLPTDSHEECNVLLLSPPRKRGRGRPRKYKKTNNRADAYPQCSTQCTTDHESDKSDVPSTQTDAGIDTNSEGREEEIPTEQPPRQSSRLNPENKDASLEVSPAKQKQSKQLPRRSSRNLRRSPRLGQLQYKADINRSPSKMSPRQSPKKKITRIAKSPEQPKTQPPKISPKQSPKKKLARIANSPELPETPPQNQKLDKFAESKFKVYEFGDDESEGEQAKFSSPRPRCISPSKSSHIVARHNDSEESDGQDATDLDDTSPLTPSPTWIDNTAMRLIAKGKLINKDDQKKQKKANRKNSPRKVPNQRTPTKRKCKSGFPVPIKYVKKKKQDMFRKKAAEAVKSARKNSRKKKAPKESPPHLHSNNNEEDLQLNEEEELMQAIMGIGLDFDEESDMMIPDCLQDKAILRDDPDNLEEDNLPVSIINDSCDNWMYYNHDNPELDSGDDDDDFLTLRRRRSGAIDGSFSASQNLCKKFTDFCTNLSQESSSQLTDLSEESSPWLTDLSEESLSQMTDIDCDEMVGLAPTLNSVSPMYSLEDSASETCMADIPNPDDIHTSEDEPQIESASLSLTGSALTSAIACLTQQDLPISEEVIRTQLDQDAMNISVCGASINNAVKDLETQAQQTTGLEVLEDQFGEPRKDEELGDIIEEALKMSGISKEDANTDPVLDPSEPITMNEGIEQVTMDRESEPATTDKESLPVTMDKKSEQVTMDTEVVQVTMDTDSDQPAIGTHVPFQDDLQSQPHTVDQEAINTQSDNSDMDAEVPLQTNSPGPSSNPPTADEETNDILLKDNPQSLQNHSLVETNNNDDLLCNMFQEASPDLSKASGLQAQPSTVDKNDTDNFLCNMFHQMSPSPPRVNHLPTPRNSGRRLLASNTEETTRNFSQLFEEDDIFL